MPTKSKTERKPLKSPVREYGKSTHYMRYILSIMDLTTVYFLLYLHKKAEVGIGQRPICIYPWTVSFLIVKLIILIHLPYRCPFVDMHSNACSLLCDYHVNNHRSQTVWFSISSACLEKLLICLHFLISICTPYTPTSATKTEIVFTQHFSMTALQIWTAEAW